MENIYGKKIGVYSLPEDDDGHLLLVPVQRQRPGNHGAASSSSTSTSALVKAFPWTTATLPGAAAAASAPTAPARGFFASRARGIVLPTAAPAAGATTRPGRVGPGLTLGSGPARASGPNLLLLSSSRSSRASVAPPPPGRTVLRSKKVGPIDLTHSSDDGDESGEEEEEDEDEEEEEEESYHGDGEEEPPEGDEEEEELLDDDDVDDDDDDDDDEEYKHPSRLVVGVANDRPVRTKTPPRPGAAAGEGPYALRAEGRRSGGGPVSHKPDPDPDPDPDPARECVAGAGSTGSNSPVRLAAKSLPAARTILIKSRRRYNSSSNNNNHNSNNNNHNSSNSSNSGPTIHHGGNVDPPDPIDLMNDGAEPVNANEEPEPANDDDTAEEGKVPARPSRHVKLVAASRSESAATIRAAAAAAAPKAKSPRKKGAASKGKTSKGKASQGKVEGSQPTDARPRFPTCFKEEHPASLVAVYQEYCGVGAFYSESHPGGYEGEYDQYIKERKRDPLGGTTYPQYRVTKRVVKLARTNSGADAGRALDVEIERLDQEWRRTGDPFWLHFHRLTEHMGATGRIPFRDKGCGAAADASATQAPSGAAPSRSKRRAAVAPAESASRSKRGRSDAAAPRNDRAPIVHVLDPNQDELVEETAFLYHDPLDVGTGHPLEPGVKSADLQPLPPAAPIPAFPPDFKGHWSILPGDERVVVANFRNYPTVPPVEREFFAALAERNDLVLIAEGVLPDSWTSEFVLGHVRRTMADLVNDKIRRFDRNPDSGEWNERENHVSMRVEDYFRYLKMVAAVRDPPRADPDSSTVLARANESEEHLTFTYVDPRSKATQRVSVRDTTFYLIDVEMYESLPRLDDKFKTDFKLQECLPGGELDLMRAQSGYSRSFMGPNAYVTPAGGYTQMHHDGNGTVNSGHVCLSGYNEVIMLRRLPERHKVNAMAILSPDGVTACDLWNEPHCPTQKVRMQWATNEQIKKLDAMGYVPARFILGPGSMVIIGTGRLHCFRKMTADDLPITDAHYDLRRKLLASDKFDGKTLCVSIAYDWMFMGSSPEAINRELATMLEAALVCRKRRARSLATTEFALWNLGMELKRMILMEEEGGDQLSERDHRLCCGILPSLRYLVCREFGPYPSGLISDSQAWEGADSVDVNTEETLPKGDYNCHVCKFELANTYFQSLDDSSLRLCVLCKNDGAGNQRRRTCYRITSASGAFRMLQTIERKVGDSAIPYSFETGVRLRIAENRFSAVHSEKAELLATVRVIHASVDKTMLASLSPAQAEDRDFPLPVINDEPGTSHRKMQRSLSTGPAPTPKENQPDDKPEIPIPTESDSSSAAVTSAQPIDDSGFMDPACTPSKLQTDDPTEAPDDESADRSTDVVAAAAQLGRNVASTARWKELRASTEGSDKKDTSGVRTLSNSQRAEEANSTLGTDPTTTQVGASLSVGSDGVESNKRIADAALARYSSLTQRDESSVSVGRALEGATLSPKSDQSVGLGSRDKSTAEEHEAHGVRGTSKSKRIGACKKAPPPGDEAVSEGKTLPKPSRSRRRAKRRCSDPPGSLETLYDDSGEVLGKAHESSTTIYKLVDSVAAPDPVLGATEAIAASKKRRVTKKDSSRAHPRTEHRTSNGTVGHQVNL